MMGQHNANVTLEQLEELADLLEMDGFEDALYAIVDRDDSEHSERYRELMSEMMVGMLGGGASLDDAEAVEFGLYMKLLESGEISLFSDGLEGLFDEMGAGNSGEAGFFDDDQLFHQGTTTDPWDTAEVEGFLDQFMLDNRE